ncbi:MAG: potassium/proton antiporter [Myxococcota bacterium]
MPEVEPTATAIMLTALGLMMAFSALFSRLTGRMGLPLTLAFLGVGMVAGPEGLGGIDFREHGFSFRTAITALVLILFDGGLNTHVAAARPVLAPAAVLATAGVLGTAGVVGLAAHALGFAWPESLLLGAVVSSTDAAAVFSVLRGSGLHLRRRVGATLEVESGLNDPMAVILTMTLSENLLDPVRVGWWFPLNVVLQLLVGLGCGLGFGAVGRWMLARIPLAALGLYPVLTISLGMLSFGVTTLAQGSGFLAVYLCGMVVGNSRLPHRAGLLRVHDAVAWLSQVTMFLLMGLLVLPSRVVAVAAPGLGIALVLALVARPVVVALCLAPFRYRWREITYVGWVGLRGAVPIVLAIYPVLLDAPGALRILDVVFFVVVVNALIPGATVQWATRWLGQISDEPPPPEATLDIISMRPLNGQVLVFHIGAASAVANVPLSEVPFSDGAAVMLVVRGNELIPPRGTTVLTPGDHVYVVCREADEELVQLMFGQRIKEAEGS